MGPSVSASLDLSPRPTTCCITNQMTVLAITINTDLLPDDFASKITFIRAHISIFAHLDKRTLTGNRNVSPVERRTRTDQVGERPAVCVTVELFKTNFKLKDKSTFIKKFTQSTRKVYKVSMVYVLIT